MKKTVKKSYYAIIPADVRYDRNLTPNAKILYGEITALCNEKGYCWAENSYFSELYGVSKTSVSKWIKALIDGGYIQSKIIYKEGTKEIDERCITIVNGPTKDKFLTSLTSVNGPIEDKFSTPLTFVNGPTEDKLKDNNTSFNNTTNNTTNNTFNTYEPPVKHKYGEYKNVLLTDEEYEKLQTEFPKDWQERIEKLSSYTESTGKRYKNHLATIRNWARKEDEEKKKNNTSRMSPDEDSLDDLF